MRIALPIAALLTLAAATARADDVALPRHSAGASLWLNQRNYTTTVGVEYQGTYRPGTQGNLRVLYGLGAAKLDIACDSEACGGQEQRAVLGVGVIGCSGWVCATGGVAAVDRRARKTFLDGDRNPPDAIYAPVVEARASLELGCIARFRLGGRLESSRPVFNDQESSPRLSFEIGFVRTF